MKTLVNEACTAANVASAKEWLSQAKVDDTVVVLVSGHGVHDSDPDETYYFLPHEADVEHLSDSAVPFEQLEALVQAPQARRKLVLLDTCESGASSDEAVAGAALPPLARDATSRAIRRQSGGQPDFRLSSRSLHLQRPLAQQWCDRAVLVPRR